MGSPLSMYCARVVCLYVEHVPCKGSRSVHGHCAHPRSVLLLCGMTATGGVAVQGPVLEPEFSSFIGRLPIPLRHGMTVGELALLFNHEHMPAVR